MQNPKSQTTKIQNRLLPDLRPDEQVVLFQRQHPAILFRRLALPSFFFLMWFMGLCSALPFLSNLAPGPASALVWLVLGAVLTLWIVYRVVDWHDDWVALTTH